MMRTTADEKRDEAKELLSQAYKKLQEALDNDAWGSQEFCDEYVVIMEESLVSLRKMGRNL